MSMKVIEEFCLKHWEVCSVNQVDFSCEIGSWSCLLRNDSDSVVKVRAFYFIFIHALAKKAHYCYPSDFFSGSFRDVDSKPASTLSSCV